MAKVAREVGPCDVTVLGEFEVRVGEMVHQLPKGNRLRAVWASLVLEPGRVVSTEMVIATVWGSDPPRRARESVHVYISQLRLFLKRCGLDPGAIATRNGGYALTVDRSAVDWCRVVDRSDSARRLHRSGDHREALGVIDSAVVELRSPVLCGVSGGVPLAAFVQQMEELSVSLLELRTEVLLSMGDPHAVVHELQGLVCRFPVREMFHGQLMRALYSSGRQVEALEVYSQLRGTLLEEFGVEPGPMLRHVHSAILEEDSARLCGQLSL